MYLVRGPSGWSETFNRKAADQALVQFVDPLDINDLVGAFRQSMNLSDRTENWEDVVSYLAAITQQSPKTIPEIVGVAFWAHAILYEEDPQGVN